MANLTNTNKLIQQLNNLKLIIDGIEASIPKNTSDLVNDSWFITKLVNDLENYYTKIEVDDLLAWITWLEIVVVQQLPHTWENWKIYLVPNWESWNNSYDEYIWVASNSAFEKIWTTDVDLSWYYTKTETDSLLDWKIDNPDSSVDTWNVLIKTNDWAEWWEYFSRMKLFEMDSLNDLETATEIYKEITENQNYNVWFTVWYWQGGEWTTCIYTPIFKKSPTDSTLYFIWQRLLWTQDSMWQFHIEFHIVNWEVDSVVRRSLLFNVTDRLPTTPANDRIYIIYWDSANKGIYKWLQKIADLSDLTDYYNKAAIDAALALKADKSEIPTVSDATINIQLNWSSVDSFTLNQSSDDALNIVVDKTTVWLWNVDNTADLDKPISTATQAALNAKQDTLTAWTGITITNNVISADNTWTWDVEYAHFEFATMTWNIIENLSANKDIDADVTLTAWTDLKEWMQYLVRVTNTDTDKHIVTFWSDAVDVEIWETKSLVFLATSSSTLELQTCEWWGSWPSVTPWNWSVVIYDSEWSEIWSFTVNQSTDTDIYLPASSSWDWDMKYSDFNFANKSWATVELSLSTSITPTVDFTVTKPSSYKNWQIYILRVDNWTTPVTMTLWTDITNPYSVDLTLTPNWIDQFVFLCVWSTFELQPEFLTRQTLMNILSDLWLI